MMTNSKTLKAAALAAVAAMGTFAISAGAPVLAHDHKSAEAAAPNIVTAAQGTGVHNTLVAAVQAAGLVDTLASPGPFTVFAPTDAAFAKLPEGTVETLVQPENKDTLTKILTYHVVAGKVKAADVIALIEAGGGTATIDTVAGEKLTAQIVDGAVVITDAAGGKSTVVQTDVDVSNGVIHVTDGVFLPA
ncbi:fasciclin domain-containing protein [Altererythrobacter sp. GH1-8]|uniref:fasciclin domain-containing protein n=1 Tax=Altererythrobacter sp. GH1-8 TaxID=3349333 RepID=UPI00374DECDF